MTAKAQAFVDKKDVTLDDYFAFEAQAEFYEENDLPRIGDCETPLQEVYWKVGI